MSQPREIHVSIMKNPCNNLEKSKYWFWQIHVTILTKPTIWTKFNKATDFQGKAMIGLGSDKNNWFDECVLKLLLELYHRFQLISVCVLFFLFSIETFCTLQKPHKACILLDFCSGVHFSQKKCGKFWR